MQVSEMKAFIFELNNLKNKVKIKRQHNEYIYTNIYSSWLMDYNDLLKKYNALTELKISLIKLSEWDLSSTKKTVKSETIDYFLNSIKELMDKINNDIEEHEQKQQVKITPNHQMRRCFKLGINKCSLNPLYIRNKIFIAMPFNNDFVDSYQYGIVPALQSLGYTHFKADNNIDNKDIMCKICKEIQTCSIAIINISNHNPNVMLELGLAYGLGKPVIIIKDNKTKAITDLGCIEYIEYDHAHDLSIKLANALECIKF